MYVCFYACMYACKFGLYVFIYLRTYALRQYIRMQHLSQLQYRQRHGEHVRDPEYPSECDGAHDVGSDECYPSRLGRLQGGKKKEEEEEEEEIDGVRHVGWHSDKRSKGGIRGER